MRTKTISLLLCVSAFALPALACGGTTNSAESDAAAEASPVGTDGAADGGVSVSGTEAQLRAGYLMHAVTGAPEVVLSSATGIYEACLQDLDLPNQEKVVLIFPLSAGPGTYTVTNVSLGPDGGPEVGIAVLRLGPACALLGSETFASGGTVTIESISANGIRGSIIGAMYGGNTLEGAFDLQSCNAIDYGPSARADAGNQLHCSP